MHYFKSCVLPRATLKCKTQNVLGGHFQDEKCKKNFSSYGHVQPLPIRGQRGFGSLKLKTKKLLCVKVEFIMINWPINFKWPICPRKIKSDFGKAIFMISGTQKKFPDLFFNPHFLQKVSVYYHFSRLLWLNSAYVLFV